MKIEEARTKAFEYWTSNYGILIQIDEAVYARGYWAFTLRSNYPQGLGKNMKLTKCKHLGEIIVHSTGAIAAATPREIVVKRLKNCLKKEDEKKKCE